MMILKNPQLSLRNGDDLPSINALNTYIQVNNVFFDEKHHQDILYVLDLGNIPMMSELDARKIPHKAARCRTNLLDTSK